MKPNLQLLPENGLNWGLRKSFYKGSQETYRKRSKALILNKQNSCFKQIRQKLIYTPLPLFFYIWKVRIKQKVAVSFVYTMQIIIVQTTKLSVYYPKIPVFGARGLGYFYYFTKHTEIICICFSLSLSLFFFWLQPSQ